MNSRKTALSASCVSLLSRQRKKKIFHGKLLLAVKNGSCMIILNADTRGWTVFYISGKTKFLW